MAGSVVELFGFRANDTSDKSLSAAAGRSCPFIHDTCSKMLRDGTVSGVCAVDQVKSGKNVICCPNRLYAGDYQVLRLIADRAFGSGLNLYSGRAAIDRAKAEKGAVAVFGHRWGGELRLPQRNGSGNYFADWVLAKLDGRGDLVEFTSIEVQTVDTTGNYHDSRNALLNGRKIEKSTVGLNWENVSKRILPQLIYKGQILQREPLCRSGLWLITPEPVYQRIMERLGGTENIAFGYASQPGALHFLQYDYDTNAPLIDGVPTKLAILGEECTTVEQVQAAFSRVRLPEPGVYGEALRLALYG